MIDDYSAVFSGAGFGDVLHIPEISLISASDKSAGNDVEYDATATTETQLTVNKHKYVAKLFEDVLDAAGQNQSIGQELLKKIKEMG